MFSFYTNNISTQAYKTWFEPIVAVKLTDNALSIQVPSQFFMSGLRTLCSNSKVALTRELGSTAKLVYVIRMENTYGNKAPFTEKIPSNQRTSVQSQEVSVPVKKQRSELKIRL